MLLVQKYNFIPVKLLPLIFFIDSTKQMETSVSLAVVYRYVSERITERIRLSLILAHAVELSSVGKYL